MDGFRFPINTEDARRAVKGAPHDGHAVGVGKVCSGFIAGPSEVHPDELVWSTDLEAVMALGREVDPTFCGGSRHKEDLLLLNELSVRCCQFLKLLCHRMCSLVC